MGKSKRFKKGSLPRQPKITQHEARRLQLEALNTVDAIRKHAAQTAELEGSVVHEVVLPAGGGGGSGPLPGVNETITKAIEATKATSAFEGTGYLPADVDPKAHPKLEKADGMIPGDELNTVKPDGTVKPYANGGFVGGPEAVKLAKAVGTMADTMVAVGKPWRDFSEAISKSTESVKPLEKALYNTLRGQDILDRINERAARQFGDSVFEDETSAQRWADQARHRRSMRRENQLWRKTPEYKPCYAGRWRERQAGIVRTNRTFSASMPITNVWTNPALASILFGDTPQRHVEGARVMAAPVGTNPLDSSAWKDVGTASSVTVTNDSTGYSHTATVDTSTSDCSAASVDCGGSF